MGNPVDPGLTVTRSAPKRVIGVLFGYSYVSTFKIDGSTITVAQDPAVEPVPGDGIFKALDMVVSSEPNDSWISPDGKYYYQIYPNAAKLIAYKINDNGKLDKIGEQAIPYNSPQGMIGY